jgi:hypothetical protein
MDANPDHAPAPLPDRNASDGTHAAAYGGLSPDDLSQTIIAYDAGYPNPDGWPLGYAMWASAKRRIQWVREAFGGTRDASVLARGRRRFLKHFETVMPIDWHLPEAAFSRFVHAGIDQHFPDLSNDAREVLLTRLNHLRCEPTAVAIGRAISARLARRIQLRPPWRRAP